MSFLQPLLLLGLPLITLPILVHLLDRQRHRTVPWAAMMFLLHAKRMTRGMDRLRFWLIMAVLSSDRADEIEHCRGVRQARIDRRSRG